MRVELTTFSVAPRCATISALLAGAALVSPSGSGSSQDKSGQRRQVVMRQSDPTGRAVSLWRKLFPLVWHVRAPLWLGVQNAEKGGLRPARDAGREPGPKP